MGCRNGFGERKTAEAFRNSCTRFIYVENLVEASEPASAAVASDKAATAAAKTKEPMSKAAETIRKVMAGLEDDKGWAALSGVGSRISNIAPDFDPRSFGHAKLSTLVEKSGAFEVKRSGEKHIMIRAKRTGKKAATK